MHDKPQTPTTASTTPGAAPPDDDAVLIAELDQRREALVSAAEALAPPMQRVDRADALIRRYAPLLPYAVAGIAAASIVGSLLRGRRVRPLALVAVGLDVWKLWQGARPLLASLPRHAQRTLQPVATTNRQPGDQASAPVNGVPTP